MRCPSCDAAIPGRDLVCGECGAFVYRNVPPAPREPEEGSGSGSILGRRPPELERQPSAGEVSISHDSLPPASIAPDPSRVASASGYPPGSGGPDFVYPTLQGWPGLAPEPAHYAPYEGAVLDSRVNAAPGAMPGAYSGIGGDGLRPAAPPLRAITDQETRKRGRAMGKWSIGLAILTLLIPIVGPVGIVTGYFAWRLGETRLGRIGVIGSIAAMVAGVGLAMMVAPANVG